MFLPLLLALGFPDPEPHPPCVPIVVDGADATGFTSIQSLQDAPFWTDGQPPVRLHLKLENRLYLTRRQCVNYEPKPWKHVRYDALDLRERTLSFDVDLSTVGCCASLEVALVAMPHEGAKAYRDGYCDAETPRPSPGPVDMLLVDAEDAAEISSPSAPPPPRRGCTTLTLMEANNQALRSALQTTGANASACAAAGCAARSDGALFGPGGAIATSGACVNDHSCAFTVEANFTRDGDVRVHLIQRGARHAFFHPAAAAGDREELAAALARGMVLFVSMRRASGCSPSTQCDASAAEAILDSWRIESPPPPPPQPPSPPSPPASPPEPPLLPPPSSPSPPPGISAAGVLAVGVAGCCISRRCKRRRRGRQAEEELLNGQYAEYE
ncbi:hypothetical protein AB1Y20_018971 [Prymnesium parvum]|uniref:Uncharacterized protein n=1 Tax=Prymnesium parvum TaxID=97485 RepID=A0AB34JR90_PRYPA